VVTASFSVFDWNATATFTSNNITNLGLTSIVYTASSGNLTLTLVDVGGNMSIDSTTAVLSIVLNPNQNPADLSVTVTNTAASGITSAAFTLGITRNGLSLSTTSTFAGAGALAWTGTSFTLSVDGGATGISFNGGFTYGPGGVGATTISLGITF
jgi:hypothetical protein